MPRRQRRRYYNPWGQGRYEFDKWLLNLAPAEGQNAFEAQNAYNEYARNSEIANAQNYAGEAGYQGGWQGNNEAEQQNAFQNILSPTWQAERDNAQAAIEQAGQREAQGLNGPRGRPTPPMTPLSAALDKIATVLYKEFYWNYWNSVNRRRNNNFIIIHPNQTGQWVRTVVDFNPANLQTEYYIVTSKLVVNDWDNQKGTDVKPQSVRKIVVTSAVFVYPFDSNNNTFTGPNMALANNNTNRIVSLLAANPTLTVIIQGATTEQAMINVSGGSPYSGGPFFVLVNDRATALKTMLTTAGVNPNNISLGTPIYNASSTATTITLVDSVGDSYGLTPLQLATFPNSGYVLPTKRP
jgi:hypothetical protein